MSKLVFPLQLELHCMSICTTKQSDIFSNGCEPNKISHHSPVPSPQTAELLQLNFPQKDSLQEVIQHYFFKQKVNVSYFNKSKWSYFEFSRTITDDPTDGAANMYTGNEPPSWGFKDTEFNTREKGPSVAQLTHPPLPYKEQGMNGIGGYEHCTWATKLLQDQDGTAWTISMQLLLTPPWMTIAPLARFEICFRCYKSSFSCADLSHRVLFPAWSPNRILVAAQQGWLPLFHNLHFCLLFPSRSSIQHFTTVSYS